MTVKELIKKNIIHKDFSYCTLIYKHTEEGLVKVYDGINTDDTIKPFLSKQVESWTGVFLPSYFALSIILDKRQKSRNLELRLG